MPKLPKVNESLYHFEYRRWVYPEGSFAQDGRTHHESTVVVACYAIALADYEQRLVGLKARTHQLILDGLSSNITVAASAIFTHPQGAVSRKLANLKAKGRCLQALWKKRHEGTTANGTGW